MKAIKQISILLIISSMMMGCIGAGIISKSEHLIQGFLIAESLTLSQIKARNIIFANFEGSEILDYRTMQEINKKYGDTNYNKRILPGSNCSIDARFSKIDIVSDTDFNNHPAGTSLAGIARLLAASPYQYIQRNYKNPYDWKKAPDGWEDFNPFSSSQFKGYSPVNDILENLDEEELVLLHPGCLLIRFTETPEIKTHTFTVTFFEGKREIKNQVTMTFLENKE